MLGAPLAIVDLETTGAHPGRDRNRHAPPGGMRTPAWPWRGPIGVPEEDREREASALRVVHHWRWLGTARDESEVAGLLESAPRARFDPDTHYILARYLAGKRVRIIPL